MTKYGRKVVNWCIIESAIIMQTPVILNLRYCDLRNIEISDLIIENLKEIDLSKAKNIPPI